MDWVDLAWGRNKMWVVVNEVINLQVPCNKYVIFRFRAINVIFRFRAINMSSSGSVQ
jgi:hypothetical protein